MHALRSLVLVGLVAVAVASALAVAHAAEGEVSGGVAEEENDVLEYLKCQVCEVPNMSGEIGDCCCDIETAEAVNKKHFLPLLLELTQQTYFKYFKADLWKDCPFWDDYGSCKSRHCSVGECSPEEIPASWREEPCDGEQQADNQLGRISFGDETVGRNFTAWRVVGSQDADVGEQEVTWTIQDEGPNMKYINLLTNPERFTGYDGEDSHRVWDAIQKDNCFAADYELCREEKVFLRLLSGLHHSISSHLATKYPGSGDTWGPNLDLYVERVAKHEDWLRNMYFVYLFVVRGVAKAAPLLAQMDYGTGNALEDAHTKALVQQLTAVEVPAVLRGFDETTMFKVHKEDLVAACPNVLDGMEAVDLLREQYFSQLELKNQVKIGMREKFQNMSRIMDCVTCEKCRLWGKLQFLGVGTALKLVFADVEVVNGVEVPQVSLSKNEVVALINVLHQLSRSVYDVDRMRNLEASRALARMIWIGIGILALVACFVLVRKSAKRQEQAAEEDSKVEEEEPKKTK